jgi:2-keto-4-pentenoate hydratase/2-oxohepta-3-ene-1,7-dioic acid hydratase in catechol pathway
MELTMARGREEREWEFRLKSEEEFRSFGMQWVAPSDAWDRCQGAALRITFEKQTAARSQIAGQMPFEIITLLEKLSKHCF